MGVVRGRGWRVATALVVVAAGIGAAGTAASAATPPFNQCPAVGSDTGCAILITVNPDGSQTISSDPGQPPYGQVGNDTEDTLIGIQNNSGATMPSITLSSSTDAFGFDGDGPCTFTPAPAGCANGVFASNTQDQTGYGGPNNHFTAISSDAKSGTVVFDGGLAPGGARWWAFDEALQPSQITPPNPGPGGPSTACQTSTSQVTRLAGPDRIDTAIAISNCNKNGAARAVVLARSDLFPDSLAGSPLAVAVGGPVLLTDPNTLDPRTAAEIQRVAPPGSTVYLLGGTSALSPNVAQAVVNLGYKTVRYGGQNRFSTATIIASTGLGNPSTLFEATGLQFPDALIASSAAGKLRAAVLLTIDASQAPETAGYINANPGAKRYAIGRPAATADPNATAIFGADQYQTSQLVAQQFFPSPPALGVASGANFPDALAGSALTSTLNGPLLLSQPTSLPDGVRGYIAAHKSSIAKGYVLGGTAALSDGVQTSVQTALGP